MRGVIRCLPVKWLSAAVVAGMVASTKAVFDAVDKAIPLMNVYWYTVFVKKPAMMMGNQSFLAGYSIFLPDAMTVRSKAAENMSLTTLN